MTEQEMIDAIVTSIQTDANLIILLRYMISSRLPAFLTMADDQTPRLQALCQSLGIDTTGP